MRCKSNEQRRQVVVLLRTLACRERLIQRAAHLACCYNVAMSLSVRHITMKVLSKLTKQQYNRSIR